MCLDAPVLALLGFGVSVFGVNSLRRLRVIERGGHHRGGKGGSTAWGILHRFLCSPSFHKPRDEISFKGEGYNTSYYKNTNQFH
jgi:hypothetical protein